MKKLLPILCLFCVTFTGCETTSGAAAVGVIAPIAKSVEHGCNIAASWLGYAQKGVVIVGDAAGRIAGAVELSD